MSARSLVFRFSAFEDQSSFYCDLSVDDFSLYDATSPPNCALNVSPPDGEDSVSVFTSLDWASGGGDPTGYFGGSLVQTSSNGLLGLNNSGDTLTLYDLSVDVVFSYTYGSEGADNQSLTRDPDISGPEPLTKHSTATGSSGALYSPGTRIDGTGFSGCPGV